MKNALTLSVAAMSLVAAAVVMAVDMTPMNCPTGDYNSNNPAYCEDYTVSATEAYEMIADDDTGNTILLDVRALAEWVWVGHPGDASDVVEKDRDGEPVGVFEGSRTTGSELKDKVVNISLGYCTPPTFTMNPEGFLAAVNDRFGDDKTKYTLITMCRGGERSRMAAVILHNAGYNVLNIDHGFEGGTDEVGRRWNEGEGWKNSKLPYLDAEIDKGYIDPYLP